MVVTWIGCCYTIFEDGLGLKHFHSFNLVLLGKFVWRMLTKDSFAFNFLRG